MKAILKYANFEEAKLGVRQALADQNLKVVAEVATSKILTEAGYPIPGLHQYFFFVPEFMKILLEIGGDAILGAPVKLVLREKDGIIELFGRDPQEVFSPLVGQWIEELNLRMKSVLALTEKTSPLAL